MHPQEMAEVPTGLGVKEKPSRQYFLREYPINIRFLSIGCVVEVGCKSIPFTDVDRAMAEINEYVANPEASQNKWRKVLD